MSCFNEWNKALNNKNMEKKQVVDDRESISTAMQLGLTCIFVLHSWRACGNRQQSAQVWNPLFYNLLTRLNYRDSVKLWFQIQYHKTEKLFKKLCFFIPFPPFIYVFRWQNPIFFFDLKPTAIIDFYRHVRFEKCQDRSLIHDCHQ